MSQKLNNHIIKIARAGDLSCWHNTYVGKTYAGVINETEELVRINDDELGKLWIRKEYLDMKLNPNDDWQPVFAIFKPTTNYQSMTNENFDNNPLLVSLNDTFVKCMDVAIAKNSDYGGSNNNPFANFENSIIAGVPVERGILVRLMDKMSRISTLLDKEAKVKDEAITDTIEDAINYLAILKAYINHKNK